MVLVVLKGLGFLAIIGVLMRFALDRVVIRLARLPELLVLAAIAWAALLAAAAEALDLGKEVGAFLGGVSLASTEVREMIAARLVSPGVDIVLMPYNDTAREAAQRIASLAPID